MSTPFQEFARALAHQLPPGWAFTWPGPATDWPVETCAVLLGPEDRTLWLSLDRDQIVVSSQLVLDADQARPPLHLPAAISVPRSHTASDIAREIERSLLPRLGPPPARGPAA